MVTVSIAESRAACEGMRAVGVSPLRNQARSIDNPNNNGERLERLRAANKHITETWARKVQGNYAV